MANDILVGVGAEQNKEYGPLVACSLASNTAAVNFTFGGPGGAVVSVGFNEFVIPLGVDPVPKLKNGADACNWGILPAGQNPLLFGDTFLRSAYVVYDLQNNQVGIAQTKFNATSSNIKEFTGETIPGASKIASAITATQTAVGPITQAVGTTAAASAAITSGTVTAPFNLGTPSTTGKVATSPTATVNSTSSGATALSMPSTKVTSLFTGMVVTFSMLFGGIMILV